MDTTSVNVGRDLISACQQLEINIFIFSGTDSGISGLAPAII